MQSALVSKKKALLMHTIGVTMIIDTHAHYDDHRFDEDREALISSLGERGVELAVNASASLEECRETLKLCEQYPNIYGMIGVHPDEAASITEESFNWMREVSLKNAVYNGGKIVAIGEIGLDYYKPDDESEIICPKDIQKEWFIRQLRLARELKMPVNIHSRDACEDTLNIMKSEHAEEIGGIIHCYSYSVETAREYLKMGFSFGIGGVVTFKNAKRLHEVTEFLPIENIVLETDAPYLCPAPHRGERNDSTFISFVAAKIAEIKGLTAEEVIDITNKNARRVYAIK